MSRVANAPILVPNGVDVAIEDRKVSVKGPKGKLSLVLHDAVDLVNDSGELKCASREGMANAVAHAGTARALVANMVTGVTDGFQRRLQLVGVGYRAQMQGSVLNLSLGYSHPIAFPVPEEISIETPTQTEIVISGIDKQRVGQTAAVIRAFRPPEPYKGKGVRYSDEQIVRKEAKKK